LIIKYQTLEIVSAGFILAIIELCGAPINKKQITKHHDFRNYFIKQKLSLQHMMPVFLLD